MQFSSLISNLRIQDIVDIVLLSVLAYHLYVWFWGTKAFKAIVGLGVLSVIFTVAKSWGLFLTTWVFGILLPVLVVLLIIVFQSEIRQVLERVNPLNMARARNSHGDSEWIDKLAEAVMEMARKKLGAIIVLEQDERIDEWITGGEPIEAEPNTRIFLSIFQKGSPLHDGAVIVREGKIVKAASYLPLTSKEEFPEQWGTRHRAAIGLTERCDAWVVVVSEERGEVSIARGGALQEVPAATQLAEFMGMGLRPFRPLTETWKQKLANAFRKRLGAKAGALVFVSIFWLLLAGQQNFEVTITLPLEMKNKPPDLELVSPLDPVVKVRLKGLRKDASVLGPHNVRAELDISLAKLGRRTFRIEPRHILLPHDRVKVVGIEPKVIKFSFKKAS